MIREDSPSPCVIEWTPGGPELRGGGLDDDWAAGVTEVSVLPDGRVAMAEQFSDRFFVASPDGSGGRWVGRGGEGPGEYAFVRWVRARGDGLHVFDPMLMRRTVLDGADFSVVRTNRLQRIQFFAAVVVLDDSSYVINGAIRTPERVGYALHLFNGEGDVVRSFDETPVGMPATAGIPDSWRFLSPARDGGLWSAGRSAYRIDLWDAASGKLRRSLVRNASWFPPHSGAREYDPDRPALPVITEVMEDAAGRLWVLVSLASDRWATCFVRTPPGAHPELGEYMVRDDCEPFYRKIEVLDPRTGRLLATETVPRDLVGGRKYGLELTAGGSVFSVSDDDFGFSAVRRWQPALRPANDTQGGGQC